jgi:predicted phosphodiesterase
MGSNTTYAAFLGDVHHPFSCKRSLNLAYEQIERLKPQVVVQLGDCYDLFALSKYSKSLNHDTPKDELKRARLDAEKMWEAVTAAAPKAKRYQLLGNHDARLQKRISEKLPELAGLVGLDDLFQFSGVTTSKSDRDILKLKLGSQTVICHHGWLSKPGDHQKFFQANTIVGHSHRPHLLYDTTFGKSLFEANAGYLGNPNAHVFSYGAVAGKSKWSRGILVLDTDGPRFVSFERK